MKEFLNKMFLVLLGGAIQGAGMGLFLFPHFIPSGGAGGLALLFNHFFHFSMGPSLWIVNFTMLLIGVQYLGKRFALWTVIGMTMSSISVDFFETYFTIFHRNIFYDLVIGSTVLGTGIGLLMRQNVSNGGVGVLAYMIAFRHNILPGQPLFLLNCIIFLITAAIIDWKILLFAFISQWISTRVVNIVCSFRIYETYTLGWRKK